MRAYLAGSVFFINRIAYNGNRTHILCCFIGWFARPISIRLLISKGCDEWIITRQRRVSSSYHSGRYLHPTQWVVKAACLRPSGKVKLTISNGRGLVAPPLSPPVLFRLRPGKPQPDGRDAKLFHIIYGDTFNSFVQVGLWLLRHFQCFEMDPFRSQVW